MEKEDYEQKSVFDENHYQFNNLEEMEMEELTLYFEKQLIESKDGEKFLMSLVDFPIYMHLEIFDFDVQEIGNLFTSGNSTYTIQKLKSDTYHFEAKIDDNELFIEMLGYMTAYAGYGRLNFYTNCNTCFKKEIIDEEIQFDLLDSSNFMLVTIKYDGNVLSIVSGKSELKEIRKQLEHLNNYE
ncbi:hypothetical protein QI30_07760 [Kurthia sp. 3B1D]|uniref:Uncharacterized protein n=1 Tax=Candidatus Kurthia intestinigallinarum TaxID=1562256 RepID=A0A433RUJ8_9BACL|nr:MULTISPECIES: hypothetical protein [unclassified Kurthia]RUS56961.1 hypothetical protein QI30_07760 [Kurthia sp. 3B1D]